MTTLDWKAICPVQLNLWDVIQYQAKPLWANFEKIDFFVLRVYYSYSDAL